MAGNRASKNARRIKRRRKAFAEVNDHKETRYQKARAFFAEMNAEIDEVSHEIMVSGEEELAPGTEFHVTADNHELASKISGISIEEIKRVYDEAEAEGLMCMVTAKTQEDRHVGPE